MSGNFCVPALLLITGFPIDMLSFSLSGRDNPEWVINSS